MHRSLSFSPSYTKRRYKIRSDAKAHPPACDRRQGHLSLNKVALRAEYHIYGFASDRRSSTIAQAYSAPLDVLTLGPGHNDVVFCGIQPSIHPSRRQARSIFVLRTNTSYLK